VGRVASASEGESDGTRRRSASVLTAAEGRAVPEAVVRLGRVSNVGRRSPEAELGWGGGRGEGKRAGREPRVLEDASAVVERSTTATTEHVPPQRGQVRTSAITAKAIEGGLRAFRSLRPRRSELGLAA